MHRRWAKEKELDSWNGNEVFQMATIANEIVKKKILFGKYPQKTVDFL